MPDTLQTVSEFSIVLLLKLGSWLSFVTRFILSSMLILIDFHSFKPLDALSLSSNPSLPISNFLLVDTLS